jgi:hypothetical protein
LFPLLNAIPDDESLHLGADVFRFEDNDFLAPPLVLDQQ